MEEEWDNFNKKLNTEEQESEAQMTHQETTPKIITRGTVNTQEIEHIPITPTFDIVLRIEEIPPLYVFYSPRHKAIFKRQIKKIKLKSTTATTPDNELMDVL